MGAQWQIPVMRLLLMKLSFDKDLKDFRGFKDSLYHIGNALLLSTRKVPLVKYFPGYLPLSSLLCSHNPYGTRGEWTDILSQ